MGPRAGTFAIAVRKQTARIFSRRLNEEKRMHFLKSASRGGLGPGRGGGRSGFRPHRLVCLLEARIKGAS